MNQIIEGENIYLRKLENNDLDQTHEWLHRPGINKKIGVQVPFTKDKQKEWFENLKQDKSKFVFAICLSKCKTHIGNVSIDSIDYRHRNARFSIFIADDANQGKGYGTEALTLLEKYAFNTLGLHKLWCKTDAEGQEILNFYQKAGYRKEGFLVEQELRNGLFIDKVLFAKVNTND